MPASNAAGSFPQESPKVPVESPKSRQESGGTFTLSRSGQTSNAIAWNATAATVDAALEDLTTIDTVTVTGNAGGPWSITFTGEHSGENVPQLTGNGWNLENHQNRVLSFTYDAGGPDCSQSGLSGGLGKILRRDQPLPSVDPSDWHADRLLPSIPARRAPPPIVRALDEACLHVSDLTATFVILEADDGLNIALNDIHVM